MKATNVLWNIFGLGAPILFAVAAIPILLTQIGEEKFGFFMLAWGVVGFSSVMDLGIGRATTYELSKRRAGTMIGTAREVFFTAERIAWTAGLGGAVIIALLVQLGVYRALNFSPDLERDIIWSGWIVASTMPLHVVSAMYRGVNEAYGQYRGISIVRVSLGVANFLFPAVVALFTNNLTAVVSTLLVSRLMAVVAYRILAARQVALDCPAETEKGTFRRQTARHLLGFGLWNTVSSVLYPLMLQSDRFIIGSIMTVAAVSAYAVPYEVVTKLLIIPGAVTTVLFPSITAGLAQDHREALSTFWRWFFLITGMMIFASVVLFFAAPWILALWLGSVLPDGSVEVAQIIAVGLVPYTVGTLMVSLVHAHRRPDVTAKSHLVQTPLYLALSYWAISSFGVAGAAVAWLIRVSVDAAILIAWHYSRGRA